MTDFAPVLARLALRYRLLAFTVGALVPAFAVIAAERAAIELRVQENLGFFYVRATEGLAADLGIAPKSLLVVGVIDGGAADKAGLRRGDVVLRVEPEELWSKTGVSGQIRVSRGRAAHGLVVTSAKHDLGSVRLTASPPGDAPPRIRVVDPEGRGDYRTITAALTVSAKGDLIRLRPGRYPESLLLTDGLTLEAERKGLARVEATPAVSIYGGAEVVIRGLAIRGEGFAAISLGHGDRITIEDCSVEGTAKYGIYVNSSAEVSVSRCELAGNGENIGIEARRSTITVRQSVLGGFKQAVQLSNGSNALISTNFVEGNESGLVALGAKLVARKNIITGKGTHEGISVGNGEATLEGNFIRKFQAAIVARVSRGEIRGNTLSRNKFGAQIYGGPLALRDNFVIDNEFDGIWAVRAQRGNPAAEIEITDNLISRNLRGIFLLDSKTVIRENLIEGNFDGIVAEGAETAIRANTIVLQRRTGILVKAGARASGHNNIVTFNGVGIDVDTAAAWRGGFNDVYGNLASKSFPLLDGNYARRDRIQTLGGEKLHVIVVPAYDLKADTDFSVDPGFVRLGEDYRLSEDSALRWVKGLNGDSIGAFAPPSDSARAPQAPVEPR